MLRNYAPLCARALGAAVIGYLGYRAVQIVKTKSNYTLPTKIDSNGKFLRFPGITVVANIGEKNRKIWETFHREINQNELIESSFALLPPDSYHLTTMDLCTEKNDGGSQWKSNVEKRLSWFQVLHQKLCSNAFQPKITITKALVGRSALLLLVDLDREQVEKNAALARTLGLEEKIPEEFHVTLGYASKKISDEDKEKVKHEIQEIAQRIFGSSASFTLEEPKLCYFFDMTKFTPWNGQQNPFN